MPLNGRLRHWSFLPKSAEGLEKTEKYMNTRKRQALSVLCAVVFAIGVFAGSAAADTSSIVGVVVGPGGVALSGATVTAIDGTDRPTTAVVTGAGGEFKIPGLAPGIYQVRAELQGFHPTSATGIVVSEAKAIRVELQLAIATFHDTMQVESSLPPSSLESAVLRESAARDVGEAMARMPGVWKVRKGGIANDIVVKGYHQDDVSVLIDGARIGGACPNRMDPPAFHLDFAELDRVELAPTTGQMAAQGSLGGLVHIVTKKPGADLHAEVSLAAGSWDMLNPSATLSYGSDSFAVLGGLSRRSSQPYADGSGQLLTEMANYTDLADGVDAYDVMSVWTRLYWSPAINHEINLSYARQSADDVLYPALMMDALTDDTDRLVLGYRYSPEDSVFNAVRATAYATRVDHWMVDTLRATGADTPRGWSMGTQADTEIIGATVEAEIGALTLGFEAYSRNWNVWTEMAGMGYMRQNSLPNVDMNVAGLSARWLHGFSERTRIELGGRVDRISTTADSSLSNNSLYYAYHDVVGTSRSDVEPSLSLQVIHDAGANLSINGGVSRTVRSPDPRERYFGLRRKGADWVGNPVLDPPAATRAELGLAWNAGGGMFAATVWADSVDGYITMCDQQKVNDVPGVMNTKAQSYANVDATLRGFAVEGSMAVSSRVFLSGDIAYVRGTQDPIPELGIDSTDLAEMPPFTGRLAVRWQNPRFFAEVEGVGAASQDNVNTDLNEEPTPGWGIMNLKGGFTSGSWRIQLILGNLFDSTYHEHYSFLRNPFRNGFVINEPGRNVTVNLGWRY
jgi:iron complex outermembrane receptor protein